MRFANDIRRYAVPLVIAVLLAAVAVVACAESPRAPLFGDSGSGHTGCALMSHSGVVSAAFGQEAGGLAGSPLASVGAALFVGLFMASAMRVRSLSVPETPRSGDQLHGRLLI